MSNEKSKSQIMKSCSQDTDLNALGQMIEDGFENKDVEKLKRAIQYGNQLENKILDDYHRGELYYFLGNAWSDKRRFTRGDSQPEWEDDELENVFINYRRAIPLLQSDFSSPDRKGRLCQAITNLANTYNHVGRFCEALELWDNVRQIATTFPMAEGNRGISLYWYAYSLQDQGHSFVLLHEAKKDLEKSIHKGVEPCARKTFESYSERIRSVLSEDYSPPVYDGFSLGKSKAEKAYREWALNNRLFINPLNDIGNHSIAARDVMTLPDIVTGIGEGPYFYSFFDQMKQEFASARFLYYDGLANNNRKKHFSDSGVRLYNTMDYPIYGLSIEKVKAAYAKSYSIFDKTAYFLNYYLSLNETLQKINFRNVWYKKLDKCKGLKEFFKIRPNWALRGLFWISKDLYEDDEGFQKSIEPSARELADIRNHLTHKHLRIHDDIWSPPADQTESFLVDKIAFSVRRKEFETKTLKLLKLVRSLLISLSCAVYTEERYRAKDRGNKKSVMMPLTAYDDRWKI